jgi:hypothetical protein
LNFGLSSASEIFQNIVSSLLRDISGAQNFSDDIIIYGHTQEQHDEALRKVLRRLQESDLTINVKKCQFNCESLKFYGYEFSKEGVSCDKKKIDAIMKTDPPNNISELRSFLGMTNYCGRFIADYSTLTYPLRELNKSWKWGKEQQAAFEKLKEVLVSNEVMAYFDTNLDTELLVDASPVGIAAILTQKHKNKSQVIAYASRSLNECEQRYSQIEREALAIKWGCENFHLYLYGHPFVVITDHRPLVPLFNKSMSHPPARIERWILRLQHYSYTVRYEKGALNPSDYMSRHPYGSPQTNTDDMAEDYVNFITVNNIDAVSHDEIQDHTAKDDIMQRVISHINQDDWENVSEMREFQNVKSELSVTNDNIVLRSNKIVIPRTLQHRVIEAAHEGHQGIGRTKALLRQYVWFPGIDKLVDAEVKGCIQCQATTVTSSPREPLNMTEMPATPWINLCADFKGPFENGQYLLVIVDQHSRYPVVEKVSSLQHGTVINAFNRVFSMFGYPSEVTTDNGPPFQGKEFKEYAKRSGFKHRKITPLWPQANAGAERFMRTLGKVVRSARMSQTAMMPAVNAFLLNYRATVHPSTGQSPSSLMFKYNFHTKLPTVNPSASKRDKVLVHDRKYKMKIKHHADKHARPCHLKPGDTVLVKQRKLNTFTTPYDSSPYQVISRKGSMTTARREDHIITRNSSFFKQVPERLYTSPMPNKSPESRNIAPKPPDEQLHQPQQAEQDQPVKYDLRRSRKQPSFLKDYVK